MKYLLTAGLILTLVSASYSQLIEPKDELHNFINSIAEKEKFNGAILIAESDSVLFEAAYGFANFELNVPNNLNTVFNIASLTKHFTGAAILLLQERGLLKTSDTLSKYLINIPNADKITLHHLLTHSSGIRSYNSFPDYWHFARKISSTNEVTDWIKDKQPEIEPGKKFIYSNSGYAILAHIIELVSGKTYSEFLKENFFNPLEMTNTGNFTKEEIVPNRACTYDTLQYNIVNAKWYDLSFKVGSGSLYSTVKDMHKWYLGLTKAKVLTDESLDRLFSRYEFGYGYGLGRGKNILHVYYEHDGISPGVEAYIAYFLTDGYFLIILSNISDGTVRSIKEDIRKYIMSW